jgi:Leucine-rich repeat (LRR) protein
LSGPIPAQLGNLASLTNLRLDNNHLSAAIPTQLASLTLLQSMDLSNNQLSGSIPTGLASLSDLGWLDLSRNQLSGLIPTQLGSLTKLEGLLLNNNSLSGPMPGQLGNLTKLFRLYLHGNQLTGEIPASITNLTGLTDLLLSCGQDSSNPAVISFVNKLWPDWQKFLCLPSVTLISVAEQDGWIIESSETSGVGGTLNSSAASIYLGDNPVRRQYRGILSFRSGANLPDSAIITSVTLKVKQQGITGGGNPLTIFQGLMVDVKNGFYGNQPALQIGDFQAAANQTFGPFMPTPVSNWYTLDLSGAKASINKLTAGSGLTQIRLRFKLDDNNNTLANYLSLFSGSAPTVSQPQLIIQYYVP